MPCCFEFAMELVRKQMCPSLSFGRGILRETSSPQTFPRDCAFASQTRRAPPKRCHVDRNEATPTKSKSERSITPARVSKLSMKVLDQFRVFQGHADPETCQNNQFYFLGTQSPSVKDLELEGLWSCQCVICSFQRV